MKRNKAWIGILVLLGIMVVTGFVMLREQSPAEIFAALRRLNAVYLLAGLALMFLFVCCEALCTRQILPRLGHKTRLRNCLGYSFAGFYFSSITPSSTGGQPAQIYYMAKDGIPPAHGALNMMLLAVSYQVTQLAYVIVILLLRPDLVGLLGRGFGALLLLGAAINIALTVGMLFLMFLPRVASAIAGWVITLLVRIKLIKKESAAREALSKQLVAYGEGAACIKKNPLLFLRLLGLTAIQLTALFAVPFVVYHAFGLREYGALELIGTQALLTLAVSFLPLPGAVGASEGGFIRAFTLFFGAGLVTPAVLAARGISFYSFLIISAVITLIVHINSRKRAHRIEPLSARAGECE
ncbi:MAG: flippase-like domain-containing protein [Oscillospiraceae bacterium]|nr:flippase-like domain-containing protein [Oscillospiraceae bacterium]